MPQTGAMATDAGGMSSGLGKTIFVNSPENVFWVNPGWGACDWVEAGEGMPLAYQNHHRMGNGPGTRPANLQLFSAD